MSPAETISLRSLTIGYRSGKGAKVVAENLSGTIFSGEVTCLIGENGAGKSTLLRTLSGFLPPIAGEVGILGKSLASYSEKSLSRVAGVVLTEKPQIQNMSVRDLIGMGRTPYTGFWGTLSQEDLHKIDWAAALVGIEELLGRMIQTLSDGERQKVMIAKALAQETPIILLDEPTAFLDYPSKVEILHLLHTLSREAGKTIFLSTHDLELALQIADRLWLLGRENGLRAGSPEDLALDGTLETFFRKKGVTFERRSGLYRVDPVYTASVLAGGDPLAVELLAKALRRNGIRALSAEADASGITPIDADFSGAVSADAGTSGAGSCGADLSGTLSAEAKTGIMARIDASADDGGYTFTVTLPDGGEQSCTSVDSLLSLLRSLLS